MPVLIQSNHTIVFRLFLRSLPVYSINGESPVRFPFAKAADNFMFFLPILDIIFLNNTSHFNSNFY